MNRLILVGNGFDLAHGLNTRYGDFLSYYWRKVKKSDHNDKFIKFHIPEYLVPRDIDCNSLQQIKSFFGYKDNSVYEPRYVNEKHQIRLDFLSTLFHYSNLWANSNSYWVDFEIAFYDLLKAIKHNKSRPSGYNIKILNKELGYLTNMFEEYLNDEVAPKINDLGTSEIEELFLSKVLFNEDCTRNFLAEFPLKSQNEIREKLIKDNKSKIVKHFAFNETLVLNFNYTNTPLLYVDKSAVINIHGALNDELNPILLGFGDEKDKFYSEIEDLNDNDFLEYMKSTYYSKTSNYKRLFDFIDSDHFQVQIMGHSCGLSDRTLLYSIFQHKYCTSIKVFYHQFDKENSNGEADNFTQITRNISRHFTDKVMMRERIVNKEYCTPLPQKVND